MLPSSSKSRENRDLEIPEILDRQGKGSVLLSNLQVFLAPCAPSAIPDSISIRK